MSEAPHTETPDAPAGGWGSLRSVATILLREGSPLTAGPALLRQNKPDGFACVSCAWPKPAHPRAAEFCENGAKATAWELTSKRAPPDFFDRHTLAELRGWSDHALEETGRLTRPMRWDAATDRYVEVGWQKAFDEIGAELRRLRAIDPRSVVFYASGRASLETSYLYQLLARIYGNNNLPDSSNMCHESTSVALPKCIGVPVGTVTLADFEHTDAIFFFGQNPGVASPRMLHPLKAARDRGVPIVCVNPLKEPGLVRFVDPQSPLQMLTPDDTAIATQFLRVTIGGDIAAISGICKAIVEADDAAQRDGRERVVDAAFIAVHTQGYEAFAEAMRSTPWDAIEHGSGLTQAELAQAAQTYRQARAVMGVYGMGLTQHREGVLNVQMLCNLLLLGGHIGRPGAGICPVRGHSNVQGQRTVGITEKPELAPLDRLAELYQFAPPREPGLSTVDTCEGVLDGSVQGFVGLGGNFLRAVPDSARLEPAWRRLPLTVHVATRLNRSHLVPGEVAYLLPCLGRIEIDRQASGDQALSVEDSMGNIHASQGVAEPADASLRSELAIVAGIAQATLAPNPAVPWAAWVDDQALVRDAIEATWPDVFADFNRRFGTPGGFAKPNAARERVWNTETGKANFIVPTALRADPDLPPPQPDVLRLMTLRSDDQFNTTVYSLDDRFRGVYGTRQVVMMNQADIARLGLQAGQRVDLVTAMDNGIHREVRGMQVVPYDIPPGCAAGYFPECNPLVPLSHHAVGSKVPAFKAIPVRLRAAPAPAPASTADTADTADQ